MMKKLTLPLICLVLISLISDVAIFAEAAKRGGVKAVILYTYDEGSSGSSVVTMEVDKNKFMNVLQDSQTNAQDAKPLKFVQNNGFFDLLEGDSSQFSFATTSGMADCDCKCLRRPLIPTTTARPTSKKPDCPNGGRLPHCCANGANNADCCVNNGKGPYCCTNGANTPNCEIPTTARQTRPTIPSRTTTQGPTYLPPASTTPAASCPKGGSGPYCCANGANNPDCCQNGGSGPYCCVNGAKNKDCCANNGSGPYCCTNGATNIDCCTNGGKGKYCCTNGADNPDCSVSKVGTTTTRGTTTRRPDCPNGGTLPNCCENGATNKDCCLNGGKGTYCCTNGANNPTCEIPVGTTTTRQQSVSTTTTRPQPGPTTTTTTRQQTVPTTTTRKPVTTTKSVFKGPTYLPVARVTTERPLTTTATYTYGSRPTFTFKYSFTNGAWTYIPRSTIYTTRETTTTAKYAYDQPANGISYSGADNSL